MNRIIRLGASALVAGAVCGSAFAAEASAPSMDLSQKIAALSAETAKMQQEIKALKAQLRQRKARHANSHKKAAGKTQSSAIKAKGFWRHLNGVTVSTSPILGLRSKYDASDLVTSLPSMNEDLRLLEQRAYLEKVAQEKGYRYLDKPALILSGRVEGTFVDGGNFNGRASSDIDLSGVSLDIEPIVSRYAAGFISMIYDNSPPILGFRNRTSNSRILLRRGFLTIGNLNAAPVYFTMGQLYVPFGRYSSAMVTAPMTLSIARTLTRAAVLGYNKDGLYAQTYAFHGDTNTNGGDYINEGGFNAGYKFNFNHGNMNVGAGYITNMADSNGMQETGVTASNTFQGFGQTSTTEQLAHRVPGFDIHTEISLYDFNILAEYVGALRRFNPMDLTFNSHGAGPKALHAELVYNFPMWGKPSNVGVTYGESWQALGLAVPKNSYSVVLNTSLWKDTLQAIEFRHDVNYASTDSAVADGASNSVSLGSNSSRNVVTAQVGIYF